MFGRRRDTGAPLDGNSEFDTPDYKADPHGHVIPLDSHIRLANPRTPETANQRLIRRSYNYDLGVDVNGNLQAGHIFIAYQQDVRPPVRDRAEAADQRAADRLRAAVRRRLLLHSPRRHRPQRLVRPRAAHLTAAAIALVGIRFGQARTAGHPGRNAGALMPEPAVTLKDVARQAGVHPATASRALNPETRLLVSEDTASRVLAAATQLGYRPNAVARSLRTRRSHTVGVLIPDLNNPLFPPIVRGLEDRLDEHGYVALLGNTDGDDARERRVFDQMRARHVDGYVLATAHLRNPLLDDAVRAGVPVVLMNRIAADYSFPSVTVDNERGVTMAVSHLTSLGHRAIACIAGPARRVDRAVPVPGFPGGDGRRPASRCRPAGWRSRARSPSRRATGAPARCWPRALTAPRSRPATTCSRSAATSRWTKPG